MSTPFYAPATQPTLYFIGVTTGKSSIMRVFPGWAAHLGLKDAAIKGMDFPLHADPDAYRAAVNFIRNDPLSCGALVTTHKIDLFKACRDLFDTIDPLATIMGETSCISKRNGGLACHAKDPISSGLALDGLLPHRHYANTGAELFSIGAGGATIALTWHMMRRQRGADVPARIVVSDRSADRLTEIKHIHAQVDTDVAIDYVQAVSPADNDAIMATLKPHSLVINATGLGKDAPGSPITDAGLFPRDGLAWDLNYRGDLLFLQQAGVQKTARGLHIHDGWTYFLHGWTQVIAEVFDVAIPTSGASFDALSVIALETTRAA